MKKWFSIIILILGIFLLYLFSGSISIWSDHFKESLKKAILLYRLKRGVFAFLLGGCLGVSGYFYQLTLSNPLADPFVIGVSQAAALGSIVGAFYFKFTYKKYIFLALFFALSYMYIFYLLGSSFWKNKEKFLLVGIAFNILFSSLLSFFIIYSSHQSELYFWLLGSLSRATLWANYFMFFSTLLGIPTITKHYIKPTRLEFGAMFLHGTLVTIAFAMLNLGYKKTTRLTSSLTMTIYLTVIFGTLWGYLFWREMIDVYSLIGSFVILFSIIKIGKLKKILS
jgi:ABC-type Fe3+-siderophore transport system permease subunit